MFVTVHTVLFVHSGSPFKVKLGIQAVRMVVYMTAKFRGCQIIPAAVSGADEVTWS
jgi:hypothetical protein